MCTFDWFPFFLSTFSAQLRIFFAYFVIKNYVKYRNDSFLVLPLRMEECFWTFWYQFLAKILSKMSQIRFFCLFCIIFLTKTRSIYLAESSFHLPTFELVLSLMNNRFQNLQEPCNIIVSITQLKATICFSKELLVEQFYSENHPNFI